MSDPDVRFDIRTRIVGVEPPTRFIEITEDTHDVRLADADGTWISFERVTVERVDFSRLTFEAFTSSDCRFVDCDFTRTKFRASGGFSFDPPSTFVRCRFERSDLRAMFQLRATRFESCSFVNARIEGWRSYCAEFIDCVFEGKIVRSRFCGRPVNCPNQVDRDHNEFRGNDLRAAQLIDTSFVYGIDIDAQRWPDDPTYVRLDRWRERLDHARAVVARWPDDREREAALTMLRIYSQGGYEEQAVVFIRRNNVSIPSAVRDSVWAALEAPPG